MCYSLALQTLAEKAAWKLAKEHGIDLVTINPVFVVGPVISKRTDATTVKLLIVRSHRGPAGLVSVPA